MAVYAPAFLIAFLLMISFWISPSQAVEKLLLNGISGVLCCLMSIYLSQTLPVTKSENTPNIGN
jgi:hypothetical protein